MTVVTVVQHSGMVLRNGHLVGYVDRYHMTRRQLDHTWRYVRVGGSTDGQRYPTRREAVAALMADA